MAQLIPMLAAAGGAWAGSSLLGPTIAGGLGSALPFLEGAAGAEALAATTGLSVGDAAAATGLFGVPSATIGHGMGAVLGGGLGAELGRLAMKPGGSPDGSPAAVPALPRPRGMNASKFEFRTVDPRLPAIVGLGKGDPLEALLRRRGLVR